MRQCYERTREVGLRINARQVEAFRAVMVTGGMTAAAELLNVTQPGVSRLVRSFELAVGFRLFERRGNQITPTAEAVSLLRGLEYSVSGLSGGSYPPEDVKHLVDRLHTPGSLRLLDLDATDEHILSGIRCSAAGGHTEGSMVVYVEPRRAWHACAAT
jgi:hypothetical protein